MSTLFLFRVTGPVLESTHTHTQEDERGAIYIPYCLIHKIISSGGGGEIGNKGTCRQEGTF